MRSSLACVAALILAGSGIFSWQRSQIVRLRAQVTRQGEALDDLSLRVDAGKRAVFDTSGAPRERPSMAALPGGDGFAEARADERRVILDEYRDVLAQMNLSSETASQLQDLLTDRVETVLDAQDAALRVGFAEGSLQMARAVSLAIAQVDRDIVGLIGQDRMRRLDGSPEAPAAPLAPAPVVVTVVVQVPSPALAPYADSAPVAQDAASPFVSSPYPYIPYVPIVAVVGEPRGRRRLPEHRNPDPRLFRNIAIFASR